MALSYQNYTGDNATTQFSIPFTYQDTAEISVTVNGVAETGLTFPSSSTVQLTSAPATGTLVQVRRSTDLTARAVDFASGSVLTEEDLDDSNIQVFHAAQESVDLAADSIQLDNDNKWDAQNSVIKNVGTPTASTDAATKGYTDTEVSGVVSSAVSQATTAAVAAANAAVTTATGAIIPDATKIVLHPINTQYTLSDGVTTDYSAKHYANVASTNATTATNAASTASTDAGTASTAATAAQVAQAAAEAALDTFDDRFLGAKASDPSVDNDGNALLDGAIYFNTTSDIMKVYDQANTIWRDLALTGTDQTNVNLVAGQISPTNNIATVAGISADITTTATNNANITTVATSIADVNAVSTDIANVNTVATNLTDINAFADTYFISASAPVSPTTGDLWFDTVNSIMKVYDGSGWVNAGSSVNGTANRYVYTATSGQTTFAATYDAGFIDVFLNGVKLQNGTDFTATDGANVVLTTGAALNDLIDIVAYGTFSLLSTTLNDISDVNTAGATSGHVLSYNGTNWVSAAAASGDVVDDTTPQLGGNLDTNGNDITFGDNDKAVFGAGSDLQIYHDGSSSRIVDGGTGNLLIQADELIIRNALGNETKADFYSNGGAGLYYDNAIKLATTSTGVNVTGTVTADGLTVDGGANALTRTSSGAEVDALELRNNATATNTATTLKFTNSTAAGSNSGSTELVGIRTGTNTGDFVVRVADSSPTMQERLRITSGGNVGIGTSSPAEELEISADAPSMQLSSTNASGRNYGLQSTNNGNFAFYDGTAGANRIVIDSSGNVGIGTSSPSSFFSGARQLVVGSGSSDQGVTIYSGTADNAQIFFADGTSGADAYRGIVRYMHSANAMTFHTDGANERLRIDSGGNLLVGRTSSLFGTEKLHVYNTSNVASFWCDTASDLGALFIRHERASGGTTAEMISFRASGGGAVGSIRSSGSSTSYNTSSDYRLKENVVADWDATTRLKQLNPVRFNFIADADTTVDGFLAHEVQDVVPEAINGTKDGMRDEEYEVSAATGDIYTPAIEAVLDEDGNEVTPAVAEVIHSTDVERPEELAEGQQWRETTAAVMGTRSVPDYQGIDQSKLVPLLVKTIQELEARIAALENV